MTDHIVSIIVLILFLPIIVGVVGGVGFGVLAFFYHTWRIFFLFLFNRKKFNLFCESHTGSSRKRF